MVQDDVAVVGQTVERFLFRHLLHWIEVMSILKQSRSLIVNMPRLLSWTRVCGRLSHQNIDVFIGYQVYLPDRSRLSALIDDTCRFVQLFANIIEDHPLLVYTSAVPFTPQQTIFYQEFARRDTDMPWVVGGHQLWPPQIQTLAHSGIVTSVTFSPNGNRIASGSSDGTIRVCDAASGTEHMSASRQDLDLTNHAELGASGAPQTVSSTPGTPAVWHDGGRIASGSHDDTIRCYDPTHGEILPLAWGNIITSVAFSPDGRRVVSGSSGGCLSVWDAALGAEVLTLVPGPGSAIYSVTFSPNGRWIASGSDDKLVRVWDAALGAEVLSMHGHEGGVNSVVFSTDGTRMVSGSADTTLRIWDTQTRAQILGPLKGHNALVYVVFVFLDGQRMASSFKDGAIRIWSMTSGQEVLPPL